LSRRKERSLATLLADHFHGRCIGLFLPPFCGTAFIVFQERFGPLDICPLDPHLRLVDFRNEPSEPHSHLRDIFNHERLNPRVVEEVADQMSFEVVRRVGGSKWIA
jgi:hypothetical protein